jgi:hypothetical protein
MRRYLLLTVTCAGRHPSTRPFLGTQDPFVVPQNAHADAQQRSLTAGGLHRLWQALGRWRPTRSPAQTTSRPMRREERPTSPPRRSSTNGHHQQRRCFRKRFMDPETRCNAASKRDGSLFNPMSRRSSPTASANRLSQGAVEC